MKRSACLIPTGHGGGRPAARLKTKSDDDAEVAASHDIHLVNSSIDPGRGKSRLANAIRPRDTFF